MKKRIISGAALCLLALGTIAACGGTTPDKPQTPDNDKVYAGVNKKITIWATEQEEKVIKTIVDDYNGKQTSEENKFNYEFVAVSEADAGTTLSKDPTLEGAPALFLCADDHIYNLVSKNIILEMKGTYAETIKSQNMPVAVAGATYADKIYGYPVTSDNGYFLWYDKSQLTTENVSSLESLLKTAQEKGKTVLMDVPNGWYANSFIMSPEANGTKSLTWSSTADGKTKYTTNWDNETGVKVSEYISKLLTPYYETGTLKIGNNEVITQGFQDGTMIAAVSGTWMESLLKAAIGDNLDATKLPTYKIENKEYQMASFTGSKVYAINKTRPVEEQKAAAALGDLLTNKESQLVRFEKRATIPCNNEAIQDARYTEHVTLGAAALAEQNKFACVQSQTAEGRYWDIGKAIGQAYIDSKLGDFANWTDFLKAQMDMLRAEQ